MTTLLEEVPPPLAPVPGVAAALRRRRRRPGGRLYAALRWGGALVFGAVVVALVTTLVSGSSQALGHFGLSFLWSGGYSPTKDQYPTGVFVVGTLMTTAVALVLAVVVGVATAAFLSELAPRALAAPLSVAVDLIAAVPSIVVGLWGLLVLSPAFAHHVDPVLKDVPVLEWLFHGTSTGPSMLLAGVVLAVMVLPTVVALSRTAMSSVALADREAARALGATRWQVVRTAVIPGARTGIEAAVTLAMGRAVGETIAVAMVIGNSYTIPHSLLAPGATLGSAIINNFGEANPGLDRSAVVGLVLVLVVLTALANVGGQLLLRARARATRS